LGRASVTSPSISIFSSFGTPQFYPGAPSPPAGRPVSVQIFVTFTAFGPLSPDSSS
jgi:hypothetical protein